MPDKIIIQPCLLSGEGDLSDETPIYKYMSIESFLYLLEFKRLIFNRITSWPDAFEGSRYEFLQQLKINEEFADRKKNDFYGSCWTLQTDEICLYEKSKDCEIATEELKKRRICCYVGKLL